MAMTEEVQMLKSFDDISLDQFIQSLGEGNCSDYWYLFLIRFEIELVEALRPMRALEILDKHFFME